MSDFKVEIRERSDPNQDYKRPELLKQAIAEVEAEVAKERGDDSDSDDSSSYDSESGEEDDEAELLTPAVDSQIFRTLAAIRAKDPSLYEDNTTFFNPDDQETANKDKKNKKEKKVTLKDYERDILLNHGGYVEDEAQGVKEMTHREEQEQLKQAFKLAADSDDSDNEEEEEDGLLLKKEKTKEEKEAEESDYRSFLLEHMKDDVASKSVVAEWSNYKTNPNVSKEDAFLMDYVLNKGWVDSGKGSASSNKKQQKSVEGEDDVDVEKDEEYLDNVDCFESKYNFRFEEDGSTMIKTYPREIEGSARRKESKRAKRRQREKLNKEKKKQDKMMEIKQMKNEKMKEIREKLREIQGITGNATVGFEDIDFDDNFDPEAHDRKMQEVYNDDYYNADETNEKPVWDDDLDDGFNMDADYDPDTATVTSGSKSKKLDENDVNSEKFKQLMEEYYSLNYEDVIGGDTFTRFKYAKTEAEDYGLTAEEILLADDIELNKYIGMKQLAPYRPEKKKEYEMRAFEKNQNYKKRELKKHIKEVSGKIHRQKRSREAEEYEVKIEEQEKEQKAAEKEEKKKSKKRKHSKKSKKVEA